MLVLPLRRELIGAHPELLRASYFPSGADLQNGIRPSEILPLSVLMRPLDAKFELLTADKPPHVRERFADDRGERFLRLRSFRFGEVDAGYRLLLFFLPSRQFAPE